MTFHENTSRVDDMFIDFRPGMNETFLSVEDPLASKVAKTVAYSVLFIFSLLGNVMIIWAIHRDQRLKTTTNKLIANMAVSDLLVPVFGIQEEILNIYGAKSGWKVLGDLSLVLCKLVHFCQDASITVSVYSCVFIAIDRYYAVAKPLKVGFSRNRLRFIILGIWILAVVMATPSLIKYQIVSFGNVHYCHDNWTYIGLDQMYTTRVQMSVFFALINGIPIPVIFTLYLLIVLKIRHSETPGEPTELARARRQKQNKKILKLSVVIVTLLFVSWLYLDIVLFLGILGKLDKVSFNTLRDLIFSAKFIAFLSSGYNFLVYLTFCDQYRRNFKIIALKICFCGEKKCGNSGHVQTQSNGTHRETVST